MVKTNICIYSKGNPAAEASTLWGEFQFILRHQKLILTDPGLARANRGRKIQLQMYFHVFEENYDNLKFVRFHLM